MARFFGALNERIRELLFVGLHKTGRAGSRLGNKLTEELLCAYRDAGRPGLIWDRITDHIASLANKELMFKVGHLQMTFGMIERSVETFQTLIHQDILKGSAVEAPLAANLIEALNRGNEYERAIEVFEALSVVDLSEPTDSLYYNAGNSYLHADRPSEAVRCYETALSMREDSAGGCRDVDEAHVLHNLGNCYYGMQDDETAIKYYKRALSLAIMPIDLAYEECAIGDAYLNLDRHDEARFYYLRAVNHGHADAKKRLADVAAEPEERRGRPEKN